MEAPELAVIHFPLQDLKTSDKQAPNLIAKSAMDYFQCPFYHLFGYLDVFKCQLISEKFVMSSGTPKT